MLHTIRVTQETMTIRLQYKGHSPVSILSMFHIICEDNWAVNDCFGRGVQTHVGRTDHRSQTSSQKSLMQEFSTRGVATTFSGRRE